jgi:hypothetical protein
MLIVRVMKMLVHVIPKYSAFSNVEGDWRLTSTYLKDMLEVNVTNSHTHTICLFLSE